MVSKVLLESNLPGFNLLSRGKVRDMYDLGENLLLLATDRISAFDVILPQGIPQKGRVLTQISRFWFEKTSGIIDNHLVEADFEKFPDALKKHPEIEGRSLIVKKATPLPVECVVRGYLSGSAYKSYRAGGMVCGIPLPSGMVESQKLEMPIFTPSTKAEQGEHDENISFEQVVELVGNERAATLRDTSLAIYEMACEIAEKLGIIIADTKFEFGLLGDKLILIDEVLTPDSSRFWPMDGYIPGRPQPSFDKQFVRDYLLSLNWNKKPPAPDLPGDIVEKTSKKYLQAMKLFSL
ncbi:MAG: phosphoribosylaminoimidazolesuccinocarboxamide synthase [Deltaproteobacteria bacterium]|nr:phosphoribosylaminoimidazolesuccinocarboxamide synthase [Deltaproteobacteria bacterium]